MYYLLAQYIFNCIFNYIVLFNIALTSPLPKPVNSDQNSTFHVGLHNGPSGVGPQEESHERHRKTKSVLPIGRGPGEVLVKRQKAGVRGKLRPQPFLGQKCHYFFRHRFCPPVSTLQLNVHWSSPLSPLCPVLCGLCLLCFFSGFLRMFSTDLHTSSLTLAFPLILSIQSVEICFQLLHLTVFKFQGFFFSKFRFFDSMLHLVIHFLKHISRHVLQYLFQYLAYLCFDLYCLFFFPRFLSS